VYQKSRPVLERRKVPLEALKGCVLSAEKLHGDDVPVREPANGKTKTGRLFVSISKGMTFTSIKNFSYHEGRWRSRLRLLDD
jgi:hypothetical protein